MILPGILASGISGHLGGNYTSIATVNASGSSNTVNFSSIPNTYTHLQIRGSMIGASGGSILVAVFNGDTGANYTWHELDGNGSGIAAYSGTGNNYARFYGRNVGTSATYPTASIVDILDYTNTNKNKVLRSLAGMDANGSGEVAFASSAWLNTSAINSIVVKTHDGTNFATGTQFALYGVK